jgi:hypothetical protein
MMKLKSMVALPRRQVKKNLCGILAGIGLMLGSFANAAVMNADDLETNGGYVKVAYAPAELAANDGAKASLVARDEGRVEMEQSSSNNGRALPEPGAAALLVLAVLAMGVVRGRLIS